MSAHSEFVPDPSWPWFDHEAGIEAMRAMSPDDVMRLAQNLARNCGYAVFPCRSTPENKDTDKTTPTWPKREGGQGYKDASTDPDRIAWMWEHWPGELIGVATGKVSNLWVLDIDQKHPEAVIWWQDNHHRLLPTRAYESWPGGIHLHYLDGEGIGCTANRICKGVDTRGEGGHAIFWFAAKFACHDHSPPAPFPAWLHTALAPTAVSVGLSELEARRTITSAQGRAAA